MYSLPESNNAAEVISLRISTIMVIVCYVIIVDLSSSVLLK